MLDLEQDSGPSLASVLLVRERQNGGVGGIAVLDTMGSYSAGGSSVAQG